MKSCAVQLVLEDFAFIFFMPELFRMQTVSFLLAIIYNQINNLIGTTPRLFDYLFSC